MVPDYSVLQFSGRSVTSNGRINYSQWEKQAFPPSNAINSWVGKERHCYYPIGDYFFEVSSQVRIDELSRRYEKEANARLDLAIIDSRVHYQGRKLKYSTSVYGGGHAWGATAWDGPPQGFRFGDYLIFMVQARMYFRENPYDLVLYNLKDDTYAVHHTFGTWPMVWLFRQSEAVPDPRQRVGQP